MVAEDPGTVAILGQRELDRHITGTQGIAVRYTGAATVGLVVAFLDGVSESQFRVHFNPHRMYDAGVYKASASEGEAEVSYLLEALRRLRQFYKSIHATGEGVLVVID